MDIYPAWLDISQQATRCGGCDNVICTCIKAKPEKREAQPYKSEAKPYKPELR